MPLTRKQFAAEVKTKYPQYASVPDDQLIDAIVTKYPQYREQIIDYSMLPNAEVRATPSLGSVAGVKEAGYKKLYQGRDLARNLGRTALNNTDAILGVLGGIGGGVEGGPPGAFLGASAGGAAGKAFQRLMGMAPKGAAVPDPSDVSFDILKSAAVQGGSELGGQLLAYGGKLLKPQSREALLAYGMRGGELGPSIKKALPDLDRVLAGRQVKSIGNLEGLIRATERDLDGEFNRAIFPIAQQQVVASPIAQSIRSEILPNLPKTAEGRRMESYLIRRATEFDQGTWTIGELNRERELVTKRLRAWHKAAESGQTAAARAQANIAADTAAEKALKDFIYDAADRSGAKPSGYFRALKQRQSAMINLTDAVRTAKTKLTGQALEREGAPLSERVHLRGYLHPKAELPGAVAGVTPKMLSSTIESANKQIGKAFPTGAQKVIRGTRSVAAKAISSRDVNALPIRALFGDYSALQPEQEQPQQ